MDNAIETTAKGKAGFGSLFKVLRCATIFDHILRFIGFWAAVCAGIVTPLMIVVLGRFVNDFTQLDKSLTAKTADQFNSLLNTNTLYFVYLYIAKFLLVYIHAVAFTVSADRTVNALRLEFLQSLLQQDVSFFELEGQNNGSPSSIGIANCEAIQPGIADKIGSAVQSISLFVSAFTVAFTHSWKLTLVTGTILPGIMICVGFIASRDITLEQSALRLRSLSQSIAEDMFGSIKTIVAFGAVGKFERKTQLILQEERAIARVRAPMTALMNGVPFFFMFGGYALSFWMGLRLFTRHEIKEPGAIIIVFFAILMAISAIMQLGPNMPTFTKAAAAASVVIDTIELAHTTLPEDPEETNILKEKTTSAEGLRIEFRNVSFNYPSRPTVPVLRNLSFEIPLNSLTVIVGDSGSGKSTLLGLLQRWFIPTEGQILIDGIDLQDIPVRHLRRRMAVVQQNPQLFSRSIHENVSFGLVGSAEDHLTIEVQREKVKEACRLVNAFDFINDLPDGIDSEIGERGNLLSQGQKQRLAIARATVCHRPLLLMDEPTSALDHTNESLINGLTLSGVKRTTIVSTHRLSLSPKANHIIVLQDGQVIEQGSFEELTTLQGKFQEMWTTQLLLNSTLDSSDTSMSGAPPARAVVEASGSQDRSLNLKIVKRSSFLTWFKNLLIYRNGHLWLLAAGLLGCIVAGLVHPAQAVVFGRIMGVFSKPTSQLVERGNFLALMLFVLAWVALLGYMAFSFCFTTLGDHLYIHYRMLYYRGLATQAMDFFDRNSVDVLASRLVQDPLSLHTVISKNAGFLTTGLFDLVGSIILALAFGWKLALVAIVACVPLLFLAGFIRVRLDAVLSTQNRKVFEQSARRASEGALLIRTVKSLVLEAEMLEEYQLLLSRSIKIAFRYTMTMGLVFAFTETFEILAMALVFWYGGRLLSAHEYSVTQFFTIFLATIMGAQSAGFMIGSSSDFTKSYPAIRNILQVCAEPQSILGSGHSTKKERDTKPDSMAKPSTSDLLIEFRNVTFAYPIRPERIVLSNINIQIKRGQTIAIVGSSGSGKSTLLSLLLRFYNVTNGKIMVSGHEVESFDSEEVRKRFALVPNETTLYRGTIRENVSLGLPEDSATCDAVSKACMDANIDSFIVSLPEGYETKCGQGGLTFSGGQRQRIAIARALARNPEILILDEPSSALDATNETHIQAAISSIASGSGRTTIIVSHKLRSIMDADQIYVLSHGRIIEQGTHNTLMAQNSLYSVMYRSQMTE